MKTLILSYIISIVCASSLFAQETIDSLFKDVWVHSGKSSVIVFWQLNEISGEAVSYVEYGISPEYGLRTSTTSESRRAQFHSIAGLEAEEEYNFRMVIIDNGIEYKSTNRTFTTQSYSNAVELAQANNNEKITLDMPNTTYILTEDIYADGIGIEIAAEGVALELDGHTVNYSQNTDEDYINGILITSPNVKIYNGSVVQGQTGGNYSYAVGARWRADGVELSGLNIDVNRPNAYPIALAGSAKNIINVHHNNIYSSVDKIESRHYPGNDLIRIDGDEENAEVTVNHNILTEGCHTGISFRAPCKSLEIHNNDIRHHQQFVNGYAIYGSGLKGAKIYDNRISSIGRTIHLTAADIEYYDNWASTKGHMTLSDMPQGSDTWLERRVELHGIKFEGNNAKNIKVHHNYMEINQPQPDSDWDYVPATPLNLACYDPNAMNEIYNNKIIAHTSYKTTHHGGYGESGEWASAIYFVGMNYVSDAGSYSAYIHDNEFISNDLFISGDIEETHIVKIEDNNFRLGENPTEEYSIFRTIPEAMQERVLNGNNTFIMDDTTSSDVEQYISANDSKLSVYPNPGTDYIEIKTKNVESGLRPVSGGIEICDVLGRKMECEFQKEIAPHSPQESGYTTIGGWGCVIDISHLQPGIYFVRVGNEFLKFVKY